MGNIGPGELLIIALIALLIFGAGRIADIGKGLGLGIRNFKQGLKDASDDPPALAKRNPTTEKDIKKRVAGGADGDDSESEAKEKEA